MKALIAAAAFAVAAPGADLGPVLTGEGVAWTTRSGDVVRSDGATAETILARRRGEITALHGSSTRVVAYRDLPGLQDCVVGGLCTPPRGDVWSGIPMRRALRASERRGRCRAMFEDPGEMSLSGDRVLYEERLQCGRRVRLRLVVRDLASGRRRVVHRGDTERALLAGRFAAFFRGRRLVVVDVRSRRVAAAASLGVESHRAWHALDADGTVAVAVFRGMSFTGRLAWFSPREPRLHRLPGRASVFSSEPLSIAGGRIVFVRDEGRELAVSDLAGNERTIARFEEPERLDDFAFDGTRIAWRSSRYRPYAGAADDGLRYICLGDAPHVLAAAPVIEMHPLDAAVRLPAPSAPAPHDQRRERPDCHED